MSEWGMMWAITAVAAIVVMSVAWQQWQEREQWKRERERRDLVAEIQRELKSHQTAVLARCSELDRKLNQHQRILRYLARRLS